LKKRLQNIVAESKLTFPLVACFSAVVWLLCGLVTNNWWIQFAFFVLSSYLMVELNNKNALIRIFSRMVSSAFLLYFSMACFLMPDTRGAIVQTCLIAAYLMLFQTYQDRESMGKTYYAFLFLGLGSIADVHLLFYVPFIWLFMATHLFSFSWRTWLSSLFGLLTPYWFYAGWQAFNGRITPLFEHFYPIADFQFPINYSMLDSGFMFTLAVILLSAIMGIVHFWFTNYLDKIQIRMLYGIFIWMNLLTFVFLVLQPQHYDMLLRIAIINTAPLIAHFLALSSGRWTNIIFYVLTISVLAVTVFNVWNILFLY
jgi:hypothetical protein